jgi:hypothetical protein
MTSEATWRYIHPTIACDIRTTRRPWNQRVLLAIGLATLAAASQLALFGQSLHVMYQNTELSQDDAVFIVPNPSDSSGTPHMPTITLYISKPCGVVKYWVYAYWGEVVNGHLAETASPTMSPVTGQLECIPNYNEQTVPWGTYWSDMYGGVVAILWKVTPNGATNEFDIYIHGINPTGTQLNYYLTNTLGAPSYISASLFEQILTHETANTRPHGYYHQFQGNPSISPSGAYGLATTSGFGPPLFAGNPQGVGLGQIDDNSQGHLPPPGQFWDWQKNLQEAKDKLQTKLNQSKSWLITSWASSHDTPPTQSTTGLDFSYDSVPSSDWSGSNLSYHGCTFNWADPSNAPASNGYITAGGIKGYNGFRGNYTTPANFLSWESNVGWIISDYRPGVNASPYVQSVCSTSPNS